MDELNGAAASDRSVSISLPTRSRSAGLHKRNNRLFVQRGEHKNSALLHSSFPPSYSPSTTPSCAASSQDGGTISGAICSRYRSLHDGLRRYAMDVRLPAHVLYRGHDHLVETMDPRRIPLSNCMYKNSFERPKMRQRAHCCWLLVARLHSIPGYSNALVELDPHYFYIQSPLSYM
jgi:hypothetical protein